MRHLPLIVGLAVAWLAWAAAAPAGEPGAAPAAKPPKPAPSMSDEGPPPPPPPGLPPGEGEPGRRGDQRPPHGRIPPIFRDVTEDQIQKILDFVAKYMPWRQEELREMRAKDPQRFRMTCQRLRFEVAQLLRLKESDEGAFQKAIEERRLHRQAADLAARLRTTDDPKAREELTRELRKTFDRIFDLEMVTHEAQIRGIEERLEVLRRDLRDRAEHRRQIVEQRVKDALEGRPDPAARPPGEGPGMGPGMGDKHKMPRPEEPPPGGPPPRL